VRPKSFAQREADRKRKSRAKNLAVSRVAHAIDDLWKLCIEPDQGFTSPEKKAVADASHSIRGISGAWINDRRAR
jgi:hypothetical protein